MSAATTVDPAPGEGSSVISMIRNITYIAWPTQASEISIRGPIVPFACYAQDQRLPVGPFALGPAPAFDRSFSGYDLTFSGYDLIVSRATKSGDLSPHDQGRSNRVDLIGLATLGAFLALVVAESLGWATPVLYFGIGFGVSWLIGAIALAIGGSRGR